MRRIVWRVVLRAIGRTATVLLLPIALWLFLGAVLTRPSAAGGPPAVIISEIAWGGTAAGSADEWLELFNNTAEPIDLADWELANADGGLAIALTGTLPAAGFFLLERTDDTTVSDIPADQIYSGDLLNSGETLWLHDSQGQLVDSANQDGGVWPAGSAAPNYVSMERLDPVEGDSDANWVNNNGVIRNGLDAAGNPLNGTPAQPNSAWSYVAANLLIEAVLYDGYENQDADEAVQIRNIDAEPVSLAGWVLSDGTQEAVLPTLPPLAPGQALWLASDADAFQRHFGFAPDVELGAAWPGFSNSGDEVLLIDSIGRIADALVYEAGDTNTPGWSGAAVEPYLVGALFSEEGQLLYRQRAQATGEIMADSDTAADWAQSRDDIINGRRVRYPGWELERFFFTAQITETAVLTVAIAPDNAYEAIRRQIESAGATLFMETLSLEHVAIGEALAAAASRGVSVTVLLEGSPAGGLTDQERYVCATIEAAGGACWFMIADDQAHIADRYRNLHAKFIIVDNQRAIIGSENLSPASLPDDDKADGTWGRRGTFLITTAPGVVSRLAEIFAADFAPGVYQDLFRWTENHPVYGAPPPGFVPITLTGGITYTVQYSRPVAFTGHFPFEVVQAPENSMRDEDSLLGLLARAGAGDTLLIQQLQERAHWGVAGSDPLSDPNPRLEAYLAAARRGARVRLLLDSYFPADNPQLGNSETCDYVNGVARTERLDLECRVGNPTGLGIHNKMILAEIGGKGWVHTGSLNGTELSAKGNREVALQVQSNGAYALLAELFWQDWPRLIYLPLALSQSGRARYVVISEIVYDPSGPDEAEFVELANPTLQPVDLSNWSLGDAVNVDDFEDVRRFPPGAIIQPESTLVVAITAAAFQAAFGALPDFEIIDSDPAVPELIDDLAWGDPAALFQLGNEGDEVLLRDAAGIVVDVVSYGSGAYPGLVSCNLLTPPNQSLERLPYWLDTNDCPHDFREWPFPSPNHLP